jgi:hypothetical protein
MMELLKTTQTRLSNFTTMEYPFVNEDIIKSPWAAANPCPLTAYKIS